jgi:hypothetical protein
MTMTDGPAWGNSPGRRTATAWRPPAWSPALILSFAIAAAASAAGVERDAHVHGVGRLNLAVEGPAVEIELIMPGADVVGFEHAAKTEADKAAVEAAAAALKAGGALFAFPAEARCRLEKAEIESALMAQERDRGHGQEHAREAKDADRERDGHAEFHAQYRFRCDRPDRLTHVDVKVFERFPATRELEAQSISPRGQRAHELTPKSARVTF